MSSLEMIRDFLGEKRFAFVGVSRDAKDFSRLLFREFLARGYQAMPVNPDAREIDGQTCFACLRDVQPPVDEALFMTAAAVTDKLVLECEGAGIRRVWMYRGVRQGAASTEAIAFCEAHGIEVIPGECPFMFLPHGAWYHRLHGFCRRITGSYPG